MTYPNYIIQRCFYSGKNSLQFDCSCFALLERICFAKFGTDLPSEISQHVGDRRKFCGGVPRQRGHWDQVIYVPQHYPGDLSCAVIESDVATRRLAGITKIVAGHAQDRTNLDKTECLRRRMQSCSQHLVVRGTTRLRGGDPNSSNQSSDGANTTNPGCPVRLAQVEPKPSQYQVRTSENDEQKDYEKWATKPSFKSFHRGIIS